MTPRPAITHRLRAFRRSRLTGDRGSTSLQLVIIFPAVLALIFAGVQTALFFYARNVAIAAAQEGARAAGAQYGTAGAGTAAATDFIARAGGDDALPASSVSGSRAATTATVTVRGRSLSLIPGYPGITINQSASVPVERIT
jgi:Flp pilus assembly protein TadG